MKVPFSRTIRKFLLPSGGSESPSAQEISAPPGQQNLQQEFQAVQLELQALKARQGSSFEENEKNTELPPGEVFTFEEISAATAGRPCDLRSVVPLVLVHIPKSGGTSLNSLLARNYRFRIDSFGDNFFEHLYPDEFYYYMKPPNFDDTRRPVFFTGHIGLSNEIFARLRGRYAAISMLRDPVERMISNYRFHKRLPDNLWKSAILEENLSPAGFLKKFWDEIPKQYQFFLDRPEEDCEAPIDDAIRNLENKITFFGLTDCYDEFIVTTASFFGFPNIFTRGRLNKTSEVASSKDNISEEDRRDLENLLAHDRRFYEAAKEIYNKRRIGLEPRLSEQLEEYRNLVKEHHALLEKADKMTGPDHPWTNSYA